MNLRRNLTLAILLTFLITLTKVSCENNEAMGENKEPAKCDEKKEDGEEQGSCGCGGGATNRVHSKEEDEDGTVEDAEESGEKEEETTRKSTGGSKYTAAANAKSNYPRTHQMVKIEGGTFTMGTDKPIIYMDGESPARKVTVDSFWLDVHEVSNAEFELFVNSTGFVTEVCIEV